MAHIRISKKEKENSIIFLENWHFKALFMRKVINKTIKIIELYNYRESVPGTQRVDEYNLLS